MTIDYTPPSMTDKQARELAKQIAKESDGVSVKFAKTNGKIVLHLVAKGNGIKNTIGSRTIKSRSDWELHPANKRVARARRESHEEVAEILAENGS